MTITLSAETLFHIWKFPVTNSLLNTFFVDTVLIIVAVLISKNIKRIPGLFQAGAEMVIETFYTMNSDISPKNVTKIFPYFMTFFIFILFANWSGLIPGVSSFGFFHTVGGKKELVPLLRNTTSDINTTFALAIVSAIATHMLSIRTLGIKEYLSRYFSLNPIYLFVGLLEIVSEITKIISLSFRLFGNIYAGEVVLATVSGIFAFVAPLPFLLLEVLLGLVQALVFAMLTMVFMAILTVPHSAEHTQEVSEI